MAKTGRPKKEIDQHLFENLCGIQCTEEEIADCFSCSVDTINKWCKETYGETFTEVYKKKSGKGKRSLRRLQYQSAEAGNVTMQIWLGKQWLGQHEPEQGIALIEDMDDIRAEVYGDTASKDDTV